VIKLGKENIPFVLIDRLIPDLEANYVILDNYQGSYNLTHHLIERGYKNIGFISIYSEMSMMTEREKGFVSAIKDVGGEIGEKNMLKIEFGSSEEKTIALISDFLKSNKEIDALFFATNYLGVMGIEALQKCKIRIPEDMAVVSFDDNDLFRLLTPSITVASQPIKEMATKSIEMLLRIIKKEQKLNENRGQVIKPEIIVRESSPYKKA
jgi:LacI family transcriptional regulator